LQQATAREASETQNSQQQTQLSASQANQSGQEVADIGFSGERNLTNDSYKIYLVKKYKIEKNDVLSKFVCSDRLFESIDQALEFADSLEDPVSQPIMAPEIPEIPELINGMNELRSNPTSDSNIATSNQAHESVAPKNSNKTFFGVLICIAVIIALGIFYLLGKDDKPVAKNNSLNKAGSVSPSFDCTKARSASEKLICSDSQLAAKDNELYGFYKMAKTKAGDSPEFKTETVAAWKERERNCFDKACLLQWYAGRKAVYQNIINDSQQAAGTLPENTTNCSSQRDYEFGVKNGLKMAPPCSNK